MTKTTSNYSNKNKKSKKVFNKNAYPNDSDNSDAEENLTLRKWYEEFSNDPEEFPEPAEKLVGDLKQEAQRILESDFATYEIKASRRSSNSDRAWLKTMMSSGTTADKMAAFTIQIQESPIHNLNTLQNFINMVKLGKKECVQVIDTLTELFLSDLLPPNRKLRSFAACPITLVDTMSSGNQVSRNKHLMRWYFEDQLKNLYHEFLVHLSTSAKDSIDAHKEKAIVALYKLISGNPEKEAFILTTLVNKLGDPSQKVGSKTIYCLTQLLNQHPAMKGVVMEEIEKLIFRPNISSKAQYFGLCFLSQFYFSSYDGVIAKNVIKIYFSFFKMCVKKGDVDTKMMKILLIGVNRAFPFINKEKDDEITSHIDMLYKIVHIANYNVSLHALCLIFQVSDYDHSLSDRFYSALYKKLSDPELATTAHHAMFLSLLYRALSKNQNIARGKVFIKRLLQVCLHLPTPLTCGILFMVSQLIGNNHDLLPLNMEASKYDDENDYGDECYRDVPLEDEGDVQNSSPAPEPLLPKDEKVPPLEEASKPSSTWFHIQSTRAGAKPQERRNKYNSFERNPVYAGGEFCVYTELVKLVTHYHPTIALFASNMLSGQTIHYSGDPLQDFTLMRFLDRFVFKNPKKIKVIEHVKPSPFDRKKSYVAKGLKSLAVNSSGYLNELQDKIPIEEVYMYKYLQQKREEGKRVNNERGDADSESVCSEDFEEMMDGLMGGKDKDLDFADDVGDKLSSKQKINKKGNKRRGSDNDSDGIDEDESDDDDDDNSDDDDDDNFDHYENVDGADEGEDDDNDDISDDDDAEVMEFGDDDGEDDFELGDDFDINNLSDLSDEDMLPTKKNFKQKILSKFKGPNKSIFASADEFAQMLEESGASSLKTSGSNALSNTDKSAEKQMKWEVSRNDWLTDDKWKSRKNKRKMNTKSQGKIMNKAKKKKRF